MTESDFTVTLEPMKSHGFFWITFKGEIDMRKIAEAHETFTQHPGFQEGIDELLDFTESSIARLSRNGIELIRQFMQDRTDRLHCMSAIVVNTELEYGLGRMLGLHLDGQAPVDRNVFYSVRDALEWMRPGKADEIINAHDALSG